MKYKCFCHRDNYNDLTKEESRMMLRSKDPIAFEKFIEYYNLKHDAIYEFMLSKGMRLKSSERNYMLEMKDVNNLKNDKIHEVYQSSKEIPLNVLVNYYGIEPIYVKGNKTYDVFEVEEARRSFDESMSVPDMNIKYSNMSASDLVAARYYRGVSRKNFSKKTGLSMKTIIESENERKVPKKIADIYKEHLNITGRHIKQLRKVMKGELKNVTDNRHIPKRIKVAVWRRDKGRCRNCKSKNELHYHHIERYSEGGQNTIKNLMLLCATCHAEEHKGEKSYYMLKSLVKQTEV